MKDMLQLAGALAVVILLAGLGAFLVGVALLGVGWLLAAIVFWLEIGAVVLAWSLRPWSR